MVNITGEYVFDITIQNMFNTYNMKIRNHNLITNNGLNFILQCLLGETDDKLGLVHIGTSSIAPSPNDSSTFDDDYGFEEYKTRITDNTLEYIISTNGGTINETTEIGIWTTNNANPTLFSRDVHLPYNVPENAVITLKYKLTVTNEE